VTDPPVLTRTLDNGMTAVLAPTAEATTVAMAITWRAGFVDEPDDAPGLAHLVEHLMFQGTERHSRPDYYRAYFGAGGTTNAHTRSGHTTYYAEVPPQQLPTAVELEADRFGGFDPRPEAVAREYRVIEAEIAETTSARPLGDFPWAPIQAMLFADVAHAHNGYVAPAELASVAPDRCRDFVAGRYCPTRATVALVGRFDPESAVDRLAAGLGGLPPSRDGGWRRPDPVPGTRGRTLVAAPGPTRRHAVAFGWRLPETWLTPERRAALVVLAALVDGAGPAGLPHRLGRLGVVDVVRADFGMFGDLHDLPAAAYLTVQAYHGPGRRDAVRGAVGDVLAGLADPPEVEVRAAAARAVGRRRRALADPLLRARRLAEQRTLWGRPPAVLDELAAVDPDAVGEVARWLAARPAVEAATGADR
jgi:predicted Zn-dependent peptidase